ncbi:MAG: hypothetical protein OEV06_05145 [Anaerolineae bacterium]|nr:hypothetical protein [Anaerolineae bacterium]
MQEKKSITAYGKGVGGAKATMTTIPPRGEVQLEPLRVPLFEL